MNCMGGGISMFVGSSSGSGDVVVVVVVVVVAVGGGLVFSKGEPRVQVSEFDALVVVVVSHRQYGGRLSRKGDDVRVLADV